MKMLTIWLITFGTLFAGLRQTAADETGLYGSPPPADAIFVRWIGETSPWSETLWGVSFSELNLPAYVYVAISAELIPNMEAGGYYSVVPELNATSHSGVEIISEPPRERASKVHILLLNAGDSNASLVVAEGGPEVITAREPMSAGIRAVNPVTVSLHVNSAHVSERFEVALRRGQNITFVVLNNDILMIPNIFGPVVGRD